MSATEKNEVGNMDSHEKPLICMVDMNIEAREVLKSKNFNVTSASVGNPVFVNHDSSESAKWISLNHDLPENFHEFDVIVIDFCEERKLVPYKKASHGYSICESYNFLYSAYPEKIFDPRLDSLKYLGEKIDDLLGKMAIVIVFSGSYESVEYRTIRKADGKNKWGPTIARTSSALYRGFPAYINRSGKKIKAAEDNSQYSDLIAKHFKGAQYKLAFKHPTSYDHGRHEHYEISDFEPLALNERDEVVAYSHAVNQGVVFVFPQVINKGEFLADFFQACLLINIHRSFLLMSSLVGWRVRII